jgi:hypothetical protein
VKNINVDILMQKRSKSEGKEYEPEAGHGGSLLASREVEIMRFAVQGQSAQKVHKIPISTNDWAQW